VLILKDFKSFEPEVLILIDFKSLFPEVLILVEFKSLRMSEIQKGAKILEVLILEDLSGSPSRNAEMNRVELVEIKSENGRRGVAGKALGIFSAVTI